ncbi:MAG: hypothetical protein LBD13_04315 [Spirochaetaceae bacterium]|jgi:hypothetical protein|nr:hypothetical protein [Spirochaetaceae bacterium]
MQELRILELLIALLILAPLVQPFIKDLRGLDGFVWFLPLALACGAAMFPVYGFRPECVPLLALALTLNIRNIPALTAVIQREPRPRSLSAGRTALRLISLGGAAFLALFFSPSVDTALAVEGVKVLPVRDEARNAELFLRLYGVYDNGENAPVNESRPMILVIPPVAGSIAAVDKVCAALQAQGFQAVSFARKGIDSPAFGPGRRKYPAPLGGNAKHLLALLMGTAFAGPNQWGRRFEEERKKDAAFLAAYLTESSEISALATSAGKGPLFLAGYGAGGSALVLLGESAEFLGRHPRIRGIIAVESPFWSLYRPEERQAPLPPEEAAQWFKTFWSALAVWSANLFPKRTAGLDRVPSPEIPTLFIVSDKAANPRYARKQYLPVTESLRESGKTSMAFIEGAGVLDYTDCPGKYPLYSAFFSGSMLPRLKNQDYMAETASLIRAFASLHLSAP